MSPTVRHPGRGLAKAGSYEPDADYNPVDLTDRDGDRDRDRIGGVR